NELNRLRRAARQLERDVEVLVREKAGRVGKELRRERQALGRQNRQERQRQAIGTGRRLAGRACAEHDGPAGSRDRGRASSKKRAPSPGRLLEKRLPAPAECRALCLAYIAHCNDSFWSSRP